MDKLVIKGRKKLYGTVEISGAKNAALPAMAAAILTSEDVQLHGVPHLADVTTMVDLLEKMGIKTMGYKGGHENNLNKNIITLNTSGMNTYEAPYELVKTMRASVLVLGPLVARYGKAKVSLPGGCAIGSRPIDLHIKGLAALGANVSIDHGYVNVTAKRLKGAKIVFDTPTVTGTENIMMAGTLAKGITVIENAAKEPEISSLSEQLTKMIEAGTYIIAAAAAGGEVEVTNCNPRHLDALLFKMKEAGIEYTETDNSVIVKRERDAWLKSITIKTMPYPNFPTDLQAQFMVLMTQGDSTSIITETIFENRFMHVAELGRMGADITVENNVAIVKGRTRLTGAQIMATDLRASASLVIAGLMADNVTELSRIYHLDRGYEVMEKKLSKIGAKIERVKV
ncbi:MAG: UDP-N-acetylglucosamine 1-carboxyvinyltransferase [Deltaproteobacteria bacterium]|nr:UDP-N-acetylglucosamine 1-carboxyvinyltransferase [Deltaproteobacteria bacterium]